MKGLWTVHFSTGQAASNGIAVFDGEKLVGGDHVFFWIGSYRESNNKITGTLRAENYVGGSNSVFGPLTKLEIEFEAATPASVSPGTIVSATGRLIGQPQRSISISLTCRDSQ